MLHLTGEERAKKEGAVEGFCLLLNVRSFVWQTHGICVYRAPLRADGVKHTVCGESLYADDFSTWDGEPCCFATPAHRITGNHEEKQIGQGPFSRPRADRMHRLFIRRCEKPTVAFFVRWKRGKHGHRSCPKPAWMLFPVSRRSQTSTQCPHVAALATPRSVTHMMRSCQLAAAGTVARAHYGLGATAGGCCMGAGVAHTRCLLQKVGACKRPGAPPAA